MSIRNNKGQFSKGNTLNIDEKLKQMYALQESWKSRADYIADIKNECPYIFNCYRGLKYTNKGKNIGMSESWSKSFRNFYNDVRPTYEQGKVFRRLDTTKPYSKDNFIWLTNEETRLLKSNLIELTYNNKTMCLKDWADELNESFQGIKSRYHRRYKYNYTIEEILFGRKIKRGSKQVNDIIDDKRKLRQKVSKMITSYKHKDKIRGLELCDFDTDWMIENIINKPCVYCGDTHRIGCDRIDNNIGHIKSNVIPCCYECNCARNNNFTVDEMKLIGQTIKQIKESRNNK